MRSDPYGPTVRKDSGVEPATSADTLTPGQTWGKFLIEKKLGGGGQAQVFQAFDQLGTAGHVALKVPTSQIPPSHIQAWIETESGALVKLEHPNIVHVLDAGLIGGLPYVATPLVEGLTMREHVQANPPSPKQIVSWMIQLADALHSAHSRGIVHRDVKPRNVMITVEGKPMLIDFGVASLISSYQPEARHDISGSYPFMAPEQVRGEAESDHRVDVFGLGGILKFLLVREGPYEGGDSVVEAVREGHVLAITDENGPAMSRALRRIANRALDADPAKRYQSAREMARALRRVGAARRVLALAGAAALVIAAIIALHSLGILGGTEAPGGAAGMPGAGPQAVGADLQVHFQRKDDVGSYQILDADALPLHSGDRIQVHGKLTEPLWAYVIAVDSEGNATVVHGEKAHGPVTEVHVPPGRDEWLEVLSPPAGTETIMLLARREMLPDPKAFAQKLLDLGEAPAPALARTELFVLDDTGPRLRQGSVVRRLGGTPVKSDKGFLDLLQQGFVGECEVVRVLAFPQEPAPSPSQP